MRILLILVALAVAGPAMAQDKAAEAPASDWAKRVVPGLQADGGRTKGGRFRLIETRGLQVYLLDTASGRIWLVEDRNLIPLVETPHGPASADSAKKAAE